MGRHRRPQSAPEYRLLILGDRRENDLVDQVSFYTYDRVIDRNRLRFVLKQFYPYPVEVYHYGVSEKMLRIKFTIPLKWKQIKHILAEAWEALKKQ